MSKSLNALAGAVILLFTFVVCGLALSKAAAVTSGATSFNSGGLVRVVEKADEAGLHLISVSHVDVYGKDFVFAGIACPEATPEKVQETYQLPSAPEGLKGEVDKDTNYLILVRQDGTSVADKMSRSDLDMCRQTSKAYIPPTVPLMLAKTDTGWVLAF